MTVKERDMKQAGRDRHVDPAVSVGYGLLLRAGFALTYVIYAMLFKLANQHGGSGPVDMLFYRALFALPLVFAWSARRSGIATLIPKSPIAHLCRSALGVLAVLFTYESFILLPLPLAVTISFTAPIFATLLSALILHERVALHHWLAVAIGFAGIAIASNPGATNISSGSVAIAMTSAVLQGAVTVTLRRLGRKETAGSIAFWFLVCSLFVGAAAMPSYGHWPDRTGLVLLAAGGVVSALMQVMMTASLQHAPVALLSPIDYSQIVWAALLGLAIFGAMPSAETLLGATLVTASGVMVTWFDRRARRRAEASFVP
ncbi:DMT family transporter [Sphingobium phenoxybenzoativorans]|uniref:DMT family transporter n=1 Tax=Sphingobium phenoxybenzoativorans TaxID=1592790 RepID=A0A975Q0P1_9SPHN|nr:DMT family transporter [Sphingobium phenoxybenzoativorans]QUT04527.1 DMT family transporter [Sphingobium phenoxybenzoativorans]